LNRMDVMVRNGWPGLKLELPHINGADGAGEVSALGEGINRYKVGDRVAINANLGCGQCEACKSGQDNLCKDWHLLGETVRGTFTTDGASRRSSSPPDSHAAMRCTIGRKLVRMVQSDQERSTVEV